MSVSNGLGDISMARTTFHSRFEMFQYRPGNLLSNDVVVAFVRHGVDRIRIHPTEA